MNDALAPLSTLVSTKVFDAKTEDLSLAEQVALHVALKAMVKATEARIAALKESIAPMVDAKGSHVGSNGTLALDVDGSKVTVQHKTASEPTVEGLTAFLASKSIPLSEGTDEVKSLVVNPSKLAFLVQTGKVTQKEIDSLRPTSTALVIYASKALKLAIAPFKALAGKTEE